MVLTGILSIRKKREQEKKLVNEYPYDEIPEPPEVIAFTDDEGFEIDYIDGIAGINTFVNAVDYTGSGKNAMLWCAAYDENDVLIDVKIKAGQLPQVTPDIITLDDYFEIPEDNVVFHMMGEGQETRHIVMLNEQAVISPSWSIHAGAGTSNYTFIWAMGGENQAFDDMDAIPTTELR